MIAIRLSGDPTAGDPFFIVNAVEKVKSAYLCALPDFGNSIAKYGEKGNEKAVAAMLKQAFNMCHVKGAVQLDGKTYHVDLSRMFTIARRARIVDTSRWSSTPTAETLLRGRRSSLTRRCITLLKEIYGKPKRPQSP